MFFYKLVLVLNYYTCLCKNFRYERIFILNIILICYNQDDMRYKGNNKLKKFQYLKYFIDVVYIIFMIIFAFFIGIKKVDQLIELNIGQFLLSFSVPIISFLFLYCVSFFIVTIWHELGHLIFGLIAKLKFNSFNI